MTDYWADALKRFERRMLKIDGDSLGQLLECYLEDADDRLDGKSKAPVTIPWDMAWLIFKRLREPKEGRPPHTWLERQAIDRAYREAKKRKAELIAQDVGEGDAHEQAAREASDWLGRQGINQSFETIRMRIYGD